MTTEGCDYRLSADTYDSVHGQVHIECTEGKKIEIHVPAINCTMKIDTQTPAGGVHYTNVGGHVTAESTVTRISLEKEGGFLCSLLENEGTYEGVETVRGYEDEGDTAGDGHTPTYHEGAEIKSDWGCSPAARMSCGSQPRQPAKACGAAGAIRPRRFPRHRTVLADTSSFPYSAGAVPKPQAREAEPRTGKKGRRWGEEHYPQVGARSGAGAGGARPAVPRRPRPT